MLHLGMSRKMEGEREMEKIPDYPSVQKDVETTHRQERMGLLGIKLGAKDKLKRFGAAISDERWNSNQRKLILGILTGFFVFLCSLLVKLMIIAIFTEYFGLSGNFAPYSVDVISSSGEVSTWEWEAFADASYYYIPYVQFFVDGNWSIYNGPFRHPLGGYVLGPLLMWQYYVVFKIIPLIFGPVTLDEQVLLTVKMTAILFDTASSVMIYAIMRYRFNRGLSILGALVVSASPINVFYVDILYLNTPQMCFFTLVGLYFLLQNNTELPIIFLCFAWLSKQIPLFLVPCWTLYILQRNRENKYIFYKLVAYFCAFTFVLSLPWIIIEMQAFFNGLFRPGFTQRDFVIPAGGVSITLGQSLIGTSEGLESIGLFIFRNSNIIFYSVTAIIWYMFWIAGTMEKHKFSIPISLTAFQLTATHALIPRGIYKYYDALFIPFIILAAVFLAKEYSEDITKGLELLLRKGGLKRDFPKSPIIGVLTIVLGTIACYWIFIVSLEIMQSYRLRHPLFVLLFAAVLLGTIHPQYWIQVFRLSTHKEILSHGFLVGEAGVEALFAFYIRIGKPVDHLYLRIKRNIQERRKERK